MTKIYVPKRTASKNHAWTSFQAAVRKENRVIDIIDNHPTPAEIEAAVEGWDYQKDYRVDSEGRRTWSF